MARHISIADAFSQWNADIKPAVIAEYGSYDIPALSESWNDYTDMLCKDGELNDLQYNHCPAWDDEMPDSDPEYILQSMGVTIDVTSIVERPDGLMLDMGSGAHHYRVFLTRGEYGFSIFYSMGSAHTDGPELSDVIYSLLSDTSEDSADFEEWAESFGYDSDSRKAYATWEACKETARQLGEMFTPGELSDLREIFEDF